MHEGARDNVTRWIYAYGWWSVKAWERGSPMVTAEWLMKSCNHHYHVNWTRGSWYFYPAVPWGRALLAKNRSTVENRSIISPARSIMGVYTKTENKSGRTGGKHLSHFRCHPMSELIYTRTYITLQADTCTQLHNKARNVWQTASY